MSVNTTSSSVSNPRSLKRLGWLVLVATSLIGINSHAVEVLIDFDARANGNPFSGPTNFISSTEYASLGVNIAASFPYFNSVLLNPANPANVDSNISGYYVVVGAFVGYTSFLDLNFAQEISSLSLDFWSSFLRPDLRITAFNALGQSVFDGSVSPNSLFILQSGFPGSAGFAALDFSEAVRRVHLETSQPSAFGIDNLRFVTVPEPSAWLLLILGGAIVGCVRRRGTARAHRPTVVNNTNALFDARFAHR